MASLEELRAQLGSVDDKIVELYEERMKLCEEIGICKIENGYKTFDRQRGKKYYNRRDEQGIIRY